MGANSSSRIFYSRVKGELEDALSRMPFEGTVIARPSMLVGNREILGQPTRELQADQGVGRRKGAALCSPIRQGQNSLAIRFDAARGAAAFMSALTHRR
jgi:uncharacterized protein YbjT (DUF2867 family)